MELRPHGRRSITSLRTGRDLAAFGCTLLASNPNQWLLSQPPFPRTLTRRPLPPLPRSSHISATPLVFFLAQLLLRVLRPSSVALVFLRSFGRASELSPVYAPRPFSCLSVSFRLRLDTPFSRFLLRPHPHSASFPSLRSDVRPAAPLSRPCSAFVLPSIYQPCLPTLYSTVCAARPVLSLSVSFSTPLSSLHFATTFGPLCFSPPAARSPKAWPLLSNPAPTFCPFSPALACLRPQRAPFLFFPQA